MLFTGKDGEKYSLCMNIGNARKVLKQYKVDLMNVEETLKSISLDDEKKRKDNTMLLLDICFILAQSNAPHKELSEDDFFESLNGDAIHDLSIAFLEALQDFTPSPAMKMILKKSRAMIETTEKDLVEKVEAMDFLEVLKAGN
ncbi:MAG: hypothetical protein GY755_11500 [Chloroflexi bacterium]|nr:hypothetical protein [Chloroflexota bacterium]